MKKLACMILMILPLISGAPPVDSKISDIQSQYRKQQEKAKEKAKIDEENYQKFVAKLKWAESRNIWDTVNNYGYMGYYQFGNAALREIGLSYITTKKFKANPSIFPPELQEIAIKLLLKKNMSILNEYISKYNNHKIDNIYITKAGILGAAHLAGPGNVKKFLDTKGRIVFRDGNKTKITKYFRMFSEYKVNI